MKPLHCGPNEHTGTDDQMPSCSLEGDVQLYLDAELPSDRHSTVLEHLTACESCRDIFEGVLVFRRLTSDERHTVPRRTDDDLFRRIGSLGVVRTRRASRDRQPERVYLPNRYRVLVALGLVVVSVVSGLMYRGGGGSSGTVTGMQEHVTMPRSDSPGEVIYVFYPGLVIEESR